MESELTQDIDKISFRDPSIRAVLHFLGNLSRAHDETRRRVDRLEESAGLVEEPVSDELQKRCNANAMRILDEARKKETGPAPPLVDRLAEAAQAMLDAYATGNVKACGEGEVEAMNDMVAALVEYHATRTAPPASTPAEYAAEHEAGPFGEEPTEKQRRIYYQDIVYAVCIQLDRIFGNRISRGEGVVCGTVERPTTQIQDGMNEVAERCLEWAKMKTDSQTGDTPASTPAAATWSGEFTPRYLVWLKESCGCIVHDTLVSALEEAERHGGSDNARVYEPLAATAAERIHAEPFHPDAAATPVYDPATCRAIIADLGALAGYVSQARIVKTIESKIGQPLPDGGEERM